MTWVALVGVGVFGFVLCLVLEAWFAEAFGAAVADIVTYCDGDGDAAALHSERAEMVATHCAALRHRRQRTLQLASWALQAAYASGCLAAASFIMAFTPFKPKHA